MPSTTEFLSSLGFLDTIIKQIMSRGISMEMDTQNLLRSCPFYNHAVWLWPYLCKNLMRIPSLQGNAEGYLLIFVECFEAQNLIKHGLSIYSSLFPSKRPILYVGTKNKYCTLTNCKFQVVVST